MQKNNISKYFSHIILVLASIFIVFPLFNRELSVVNEYRIHIIRIESILEVLKDGVFPPLISPKFMNGFGYALNVFYGPLTTYLPMIFSVSGRIAEGLKYFTFVTVLCSAYSMYFFVKKVTKSEIASVISGILYIASPYKLTNIYSRNAVGEYTGLIFLPILFNGLYELLEGNKNKNYYILIGVLGLILSHTITTIYAFLYMGIYLLFKYKKIFKRTVIVLLLKNISLAILISMFYIIPLLNYKYSSTYSIYVPEMMGTTGEHVSKNSLKFSDFFENETILKDIGEDSYPTFAIGILAFSGLLLSVLCYKKVDEKYKKEYIYFLILGIISAVFCTNLIPWKNMPGVLTVIQFAWRNLGFLVFFISFICGINIKILSENYTRYIFLIFIILQLGIASLYTTKYIMKRDNQDLKYEENLKQTKLSVFSVNREYMPYKAALRIDYITNRSPGLEVLSGKISIKTEEKDKLNYLADIELIESAEIELPYLFYPNYEVKLNGTKLDIFESENGFVKVKLNESGKLESKYYINKLQLSGYIISVLGIILSIIFISNNIRKEKFLLDGGKNG